MANAKISALTALTGANVDTATDVLPIVDTSLTTTKKILVDELAIAVSASQAEVNAMVSTNTLLTPSIAKIVLGTIAASTSGTAIDFIGIPAGVRRIIISLNGVSLSGTDSLLVQLGDSGGFETSGYISSSAQLGDATAIAVGSSTSGFYVNRSSASYTTSGHIVLTLVDAATFLWVSSHTVKNITNVVATGAGDKALSAELTQVRITRTGTDTFDAGSINISLER